MQQPDFDRELARASIDTIRLLAADMVEKAQSGHPGTPMEAAPIAYLLYTRHLRHSPANPDWPGRDRFVLSCGHASALLYSMLHLTGYGLSLDDLKNFRQLGSPTAGHPEFGHAPGIETTTGPLGQGIAVAAGMAMGARFLQQRVSKELFDYHVYALCSDGDLMEGVAAEAASLAGHLRLGNLICLYLDNKITIEGDTDLAFTEDVGTRFLSYGWQVLRVEGENVGRDRPRHRQGQAFAAPLADHRPLAHRLRRPDQAGQPRRPRRPPGRRRAAGHQARLRPRSRKQSFVIPAEVAAHMGAAKARGAELEKDWQAACKQEAAQNQALAEWQLLAAGKLPAGWDTLPEFAPGEKLATRQASGKVLNALADKLPLLLGGSADLGPSNNTNLKDEGSFTACTVGRNIHFGVREHAMGAFMNGLAHTPGLIPFGGTFMIFADYMRPPMRLAAMMGLGTIYVLTHDSIGLGEDGPTHQPIEQLPNLRAVPNLDRDPPRRRHGNRRGLEGRHRQPPRADRPDPLPPGPADPRPQRLRCRGRGAARRLRAGPGRGGAQGADHRQRLGSAAGPGRARAAAKGGDRRARRLPAVLGAVRAAVPERIATKCCRRPAPSGWRWKPPRPSAGNATSAAAAGSSA